MTSALTALVLSVLAVLGGAGVLHVLPTLGRRGRAWSARLVEAPLVDVVVGYFTLAPPVVGAIAAGWWGLLGAVAGQVGGLLVWVQLHEVAHLEARRGPRIVKVVNGLVGRFRNHAALWVTTLALPGFWIIRLGQILVYPLLERLLGFPGYEQRQWINVSRQKFRGLVGHDLAWCLYCDWMTGVWSLGSEMLRNVESFWCPIRFSNEAKCANCLREFPDLEGGWVGAGGTMAEVAEVLEARQSAVPRTWFGHPARLTVDGKPPAEIETRPDPVIPEPLDRR